ncbi:MAG TPA: type Z 30S ribosomal protein S14 [Thermoanaerobaculia bacterium]|jgi:small subunit ribosomal protein S14|nr:type Z 30S ribosomal protein S14 [Thermoanaerobaculia bacterium]
MARRAAIVKVNSVLKFAVRKRNRCKICGRGRAYLRKFGMCRICFRNLALGGYIPGVGKASW